MTDFLTQAYEFGKQGNYRPAIALLDQVLQDEPEHVDALYLRGMAYFYLKDFEAARRDWDAALAVAPGCRPVREAIQYLIDRGRDPLWLQSVQQPETSLAEPNPLPIRDARPLLRQKLFDLFFRPSRFFAFNAPSYTNLQRWGLMWLVGAGGTAVLDVIQEEHELYFLSLPTWLIVVSLFLVMPWICGGFSYLIFGWWFCLRLRFCGVKQINSLQGRDLYLTVKPIQALPLLGFVLLGFMFFVGVKPFYYWLRWHYGWMFVLIAIMGIWSSYVAYRGVRVYARAGKGSSRIWFLALPWILYTIFLLLGFGNQYMLSNSVPDIAHPESVEFHGVRMSYPGNWAFFSIDDEIEWIEEPTTDEPEDIESTDTEDEPLVGDESSREEDDVPFFCGLEAEFADMYFNLSIWNHESNLEERIEENIPEGDGDRIKVSKYREPFDRWGNYSGKGIFYYYTEDKERYCHRIFAANVNGRSFLIMEQYHVNVSDISDRGFDLVRQSFAIGVDSGASESL